MSSEITRDGLVAITIVQGTAGVAVYLNGYRIAGTKPTVNDQILCECTTNVEDLEQVLRDWKTDRHLMVCADPECDAPLREYRDETVVRPGWVRRAYTCIHGHTTQVSHRYTRADQQPYWPGWPPDTPKGANE